MAAPEKVQGEILHESDEVRVFGTAVFENCPDGILSDEYFVSLQKFIFSETHLQSNIADVKFQPGSSRQSSDRQYIHTVAVEIIVKTANLNEPPRAYIFKHLGKSDWLRGNKTRITLEQIHLK